TRARFLSPRHLTAMFGPALAYAVCRDGTDPITSGKLPPGAMASASARRIGAFVLTTLFSAAACPRFTLPAAMSDQDFWALSESLSEPPGTFAISDNFVSNEPR